MTIKVGINGFGRIGRSIFRASKLYKEFDNRGWQGYTDNSHQGALPVAVAGNGRGIRN